MGSVMLLPLRPISVMHKILKEAKYFMSWVVKNAKINN